MVPPEPTRLGEVVWLEPYPDTLLEGAMDVPLGPEARYEQAESISLAFVKALQLLPHRQLAVVILRDVLGFQAIEVAAMLDTSVESVNSLLKRARSGLQAQQAPAAAGGSRAAEDAIVAKFVSAYESSDVDALVAMLTDDVFMAMPPIPFEYVGREPVMHFMELLFGLGRKYELAVTRANGQPALASYIRLPDGSRRASGLLVLGLNGDRISAMTRFENSVLPWFGLPPSHPSV